MEGFTCLYGIILIVFCHAVGHRRGCSPWLLGNLKKSKNKYYTNESWDHKKIEQHLKHGSSTKINTSFASLLSKWVCTPHKVNGRPLLGGQSLWEWSQSSSEIRHLRMESTLGASHSIYGFVLLQVFCRHFGLQADSGPDQHERSSLSGPPHSLIAFKEGCSAAWQ